MTTLDAEPTPDHDGRPSPPASAAVLCPFCGTSQTAEEIQQSGACRACKNRLDPMSRIATHNAMGPWFVRDLSNPFAPGCSYQTLTQMCARGRVKLNSVIRGPTTHQFWKLAAHTPGVAVLLGQCHACAEHVEIDATTCPACHCELRPAVAAGPGRFVAIDDRQHLGLPPEHPLTSADDTEAALDALLRAMGHAAAPRQADPAAVALAQAGPLARAGHTRSLVAMIVVLSVLLVGLALWAVVLPALGVATGVQEITSLGRPASGTATNGSGAGPAGRAGGSGGGSGIAPGASPPSTPNAPASALAPTGPAGSGGQDEDATTDADDPASPENTENAEKLLHVQRMVAKRHREALAGGLNELRALREAIAELARAQGGLPPDSLDFVARWPVIAAMDRWAAQRIAEREALDRLGVP
jgi:hypothetical protein